MQARALFANVWGRKARGAGSQLLLEYFGLQLGDEGEGTELFIEVEAVAHHELVGDVESHVGALHIDALACFRLA